MGNIRRNPRFDHQQHWAEFGDIGQTYGTLGRNLLGCYKPRHVTKRDMFLFINSKFLPNVPNVCPMSPISAQCPICLPNVPNFCPMLFAVKSRISSDTFSIYKTGHKTPKCFICQTNLIFFNHCVLWHIVYQTIAVQH